MLGQPEYHRTDEVILHCFYLLVEQDARCSCQWRTMFRVCKSVSDRELFLKERVATCSAITVSNAGASGIHHKRVSTAILFVHPKRRNGAHEHDGTDSIFSAGKAGSRARCSVRP